MWVVNLRGDSMGKKSVRQDKNMFFTAREEAEMTRAQASELSNWLSESKIEKIESDKQLPDPEEVLEMSRIYSKPLLCNQYCSGMCAIGQKYIPEIRVTDLSQIVLTTLSSLNAINQDKDRLVEIAADGSIEKDEIEEFMAIKAKLEKISLAVESLKMWVDSMESEGVFDK